MRRQRKDRSAVVVSDAMVAAVIMVMICWINKGDVEDEIEEEQEAQAGLAQQASG